MDAIATTVNLAIDGAETAVRKALEAQGFGVLTEIDLAATFRAKLGVEGPPRKILGACNPSFAYRALELDPSVSLVLPCNVVLEEIGGVTLVAIVDPIALLSNPALADLAAEAGARLTAVAEALAGP